MIFLLDTNILLIYLRDILLSEIIDRKYDPLNITNRPLISVVTIGEIRSLAIQNKWGKVKRENLDNLMNKIVIVDINSEDILQRYAEIDAFSQGKLDGKLLKMSARNMGKNDIWIAATASVTGATLLTTDKDFDHLKNEFLSLERIDLNENI